MCDRDVFEGDVKFLGPAEEVRTDAVRDRLPLGDEFGGIELGNNGLEDFVADRGEDSLVVVKTEGLCVLMSYCTTSSLSDCEDRGIVGAELFEKGAIVHLIDLGQHLNFWPMQHPQR